MPDQLLDREIVEQLKSMIEVNPEFGETVISLYEQSSDPLVSQMHEQLRDKDFGGLADSAHSLKGASLNIGGHQLGMLLKDMQHAAESEDATSIEHLLSQIETLKLETLESLKQEFGVS